MKNLHRFRYEITAVLVIVASTLVWPCAGPQPPQDPSSAPPVPARPADNGSPVPAEDKPRGDGSQNSPGENKISPQQAEELFQSVDVIIRFASRDTGLPIHEAVKRRLTSRDEVTSYLEKHMGEDEEAQRLRRSELVLKKFGLLPRNFDLQAFLIALLREQVAGYYDPQTRTVNLLDWVGLEQQRPVLAHELTHALQDQSFDLEKWMKAGLRDLSSQKQDPSPEDIARDEAQAVRQAVVEGQAMAVLIDYMLAPVGQSLASSPQVVDALKSGMLVGTADSIQFQNAPVFLKEVLTFPYRYGLDFIGQILLRDGKEKAFAGVFKNPPTTTRQIMQPATYLSGEHLDPLPTPEFARLANNYSKFDVGSMGEFDVAMLVDQYAGVELSQQLYPNWRGGYYYAARPKTDSKAALALLYVSRWASPEAAGQFAAIYAQSLKSRYHSAHVVAQPGHPAEDVIDKTLTLSGNREWLTEDGDVLIDREGDMVFVTESFDEVTAKKLRDAIMALPRADLDDWNTDAQLFWSAVSRACGVNSTVWETACHDDSNRLISPWFFPMHRDIQSPRPLLGVAPTGHDCRADHMSRSGAPQ